METYEFVNRVAQLHNAYLDMNARRNELEEKVQFNLLYNKKYADVKIAYYYNQTTQGRFSEN